MKKVLLAAATVYVLGLVSCKEKGPTIDFGNGPVIAFDTSYMATVEAPQQRNVIVEEFTGAKCPNCPAAREVLTSIASKHEGRVFPVEIHIFKFGQSDPADGAKYDLRTNDGSDIGTTFYTRIGTMPGAGINRIPINSEMLLYPSSKWATPIEAQLAIAPVANVTVTSDYEEATRVATIKVKIAYTKAVSGKQFLSLAILEDNIVDIQEFPDRFENNYNYMHTLRDLATAVSGDEFLKDASQKSPGQVYERGFVYTVDQALKPENCKVIAFLHNNSGDSKEILQAAEVKMKK